MSKDAGYNIIIKPKSQKFSLHTSEIWAYRDLLIMFIKRDFVTYYKQTILGPIWFFIQPIFTTLIYMFVFGNLAGIPTDGIPKPLFYMAGITFWNYFSECLTKTSNVFKVNQQIFSKVYFPRLITPLSIVISNLIKLGIQMALLLSLWLYFKYQSPSSVSPNVTIFLIPYLVILLASLGLGMGMIISSLTTKYRDLVFLLQFGIQLFMYATPVIYPLSETPQKYRWLIELNPLTPIMESFRYGLLGQGHFTWSGLIYSTCVVIVSLLLGAFIFNKTEKTFVDTV